MLEQLRATHHSTTFANCDAELTIKRQKSICLMDIIHKIGLDICKAIQNVEQTFLKYFFEHATIRYSFVMMIHK